MFQTNQRKTQNTAGKDSTHFLIPINYRHLAVEHNPPQKKNMQAAKFHDPRWGGGWKRLFFFKSFRVGEVVWVLQSFVDLPRFGPTTATLSPTNKNSQKHCNPPEVRPGWEFVPGPDGTVPYRYQCTTKKNGDTITIFVLCSNSQETMN